MRQFDFLFEYLRTVTGGRVTGKTLAAGLACLVVLILAARGCSSASSSTPKAVRGRWTSATSSNTNYWNQQNGVYGGNARGSSQLYEFDRWGGYKYYLLMELRTYGLVTRAESRHEGRVEFNGDRFTLHPVSGHYHNEGGSTSDRAMNAGDLAKLTKNYHWRTAAGPDGGRRLIVGYEKGGSSEFRPAPDPPGKR